MAMFHDFYEVACAKFIAANPPAPDATLAACKAGVIHKRTSHSFFSLIE
jgi:hypothetical protein